MPKKDELTSAVEEIYPDLSPEEVAEAKENLVQYLGVVNRIFARVSRENPKILTELRRRASLRERKEKA